MPWKQPDADWNCNSTLTSSRLAVSTGVSVTAAANSRDLEAGRLFDGSQIWDRVHMSGSEVLRSVSEVLLFSFDRSLP